MFIPWWMQLQRREQRKARRPARRRSFFQPRLEILEDRRVPATLSVTTTADSGAGSLRQAILDANDTTTNPGQNTIDFSIGTSGSQTISLASPLPAITNTSGVIIDGTSEPGFTTTPLIVLNGSGAGSGDGLDIDGGNSTVKGLVIQDFASGAAIGLASNDNTIQEDYLGTNAGGTTAAANSIGIEVVAATGNTIGGTTAAARNVISGNGTIGVIISGSGATGNLVEGNDIGTDQTGALAVANTDDGVDIVNGATANTIGGSATGTGNSIAGNGRYGVLLGVSGTSDNVVEGNFIGTNTAGATTLANTASGVGLVNGASSNTIGGTATAAANVISGNGDYGILVTDSTTTDNLIEGNNIGTNPATTTSPLGNKLDGIALLGAPDTTIGGSATGAGNVIVGNAIFGIFVGGSDTVIQGNAIGTNTTGATGLSNTSDGIIVMDGSNTIGGTASGAGNTISGNGEFGIQLLGAGATGNLVEGNFIGANQAGTSSLPNTEDGVGLYDGATGNTIGGTATGAGNVLSGNSRFGVLISDTGTSNNVVEGNQIGVNKAATAALANTNDGVALLNGATANTIGGTVSGADNVISGNDQIGVLIGTSATSGNLVQGNFIGTNSSGSVSLANGFFGVALATGASSNTIGGSVSGAGNTIAFNGSAGVIIGTTTSDTAAGDPVSENAIYENGGTGGIGIANVSIAGTTASPLPATASLASGVVTTTFTLGSVASSTFLVEFFLNNSGDSAQGRFFLGSATVTTDATGALSTVTTGSVSAGTGTITLTPPTGVTPSVGQTLTATAILQNASGTTTETAGNTSEFSPAISLTGLPLSPSTLPAGDINIAYNQTISASGGTAPYTFAQTSGTLPTGLSLNTSTGVISGTPTTTSGSPFTFTITATDSATPTHNTGSKSYTVTINPAVAVTTTTLSNWTVNQPGYSQTVSASGGSGTYTFTSVGTLPPGLTLSSAGVLSGTPTTAGSFTFAVTATDTLGSSANEGFTVVINPAVTITTIALANWTAFHAGYSQAISATGGTGSLTFSAPAADLPTGLTLNSTGLLAGTPTAPGTYTFTVTATDSVGATGTDNYTVVINPIVTVSTPTLANWTVDQSGYSQTITATGGTGALTFSAPAASLPTGLTLSTAGVLSGTPTATGTFTFIVTATDSLGVNGTHSYTVVINPAVTITTTALPGGTVGTAYNQTISATGGTGALTFSVPGASLPSGLTLSTTGVLSGTPTTADSFTFTVTATDSVAATGTQGYTVVIGA